MGPTSVLPSLKDLVDNFTPGGCYGIEWQLNGDLLTYKTHYNPQWRIDAVKAKGLNGLYTDRSAGYTFAVGQGLVGRVFAKQEVLFVRDLQTIDECSVMDALQGGNGCEYLRADLAKEFNLHSAIFLPFSSGVLEVGSNILMTSLPQYFAPYANSSTPPLAEGPAPQGSVDASTAPPPKILQKLVENLTSAGCYGIEWIEDGGALKYRSHFNPQWRIEGLKHQGLNGAYTTKSKGFTFAKGEGLVGNAFAGQSVLFVKDVQEVTPDEMKASMQSGSGVSFLRADIAREFGIRSMMLLPSPGGVLEVGSVRTCDDLQGFLSEPAAKAVGGNTDAAHILSALQAVVC